MANPSPSTPTKKFGKSRAPPPTVPTSGFSGVFLARPSSNPPLPPRIPAAPFKIDFIMFMVTTTADTTRKAILGSAEFNEYMALRHLIKVQEMELISAQTTVDVEVNLFYSRNDRPVKLEPAPDREAGIPALPPIKSTPLNETDAAVHLKALSENHARTYMRFLFVTVMLLSMSSSLPLPSSFTFRSLPVLPPSRYAHSYTASTSSAGYSGGSLPPPYGLYPYEKHDIISVVGANDYSK